VLEAAACRETLEETGAFVKVETLIPLGSIDYTKSRKRIFAFAGETAADVEPRCASWEIDQARFMSIEEARRLLHPEQTPFLDRLLAHVNS
jgi:predicted NUDIX family NTP pyrophosphohydrolase